jgi:hypothetical protein
MGAAMTDDNVIDFAAQRDRAEGLPTRSERIADRRQEAMTLLNKLREKKRLPKDDQEILVGNLGRLVARFEPNNRMLLAERILLPDHWPKRKRYVRFPDEIVRTSVRHAASGGTFAGIIDRLIDEQVRKGLDRPLATIETVRGALKGTSFHQPTRFQIESGVDDGDAAYLLWAIEKAFEKLAQEVDVAEHFDLVSKYPIYPDCPWHSSSSSLKLVPKYDPADIYDWDWLTDDDEICLQRVIPWWAPRCLIGNLYIPFETGCLHLPEKGIAEVKQACGGDVTEDSWEPGYSRLLLPFLKPEWIRPRRVYYRLPVLLIALPRPNRLVPCLYASIASPTGFQKEGRFRHNDTSPVMPCFVAAIGDEISDDDVYFSDICDEDEDNFHVSAVKSEIFVIGSGIEQDGEKFTSDFWIADSIDDIPDWLQPYYVQRLLKLTPDSELGKLFALSRRTFVGRWCGNDGTIFRPAFQDSLVQTRLRQNTIGAYLLRNLLDPGGMFGALISDALEKSAATKEAIESALSTFQDAFDKCYGKDRL